jgi:flagellum-specific peptidoglycan hydrolase FlgJ
LWRSADAAADAVRQLDRFTPLLLVDGPVQDRVQVWTYRSDLSGVLDQGWVDTSSTGPALAPQMRVPSPTDKTFTMRGTNATGQQQIFLDTAAQAARDSAVMTGVPASVTVAQAILESDWGRSQLAQSANNYFGIKAMGPLSPDGVIWLPTSEYDDAGQLYQTISAFRAYKSLTDSMTDHDLLLETSSRYAAAMRAAQDPKQFATLLAKAGYSTDPAYADKLISLMDRYNLYQLDA